MTNGFHPHKKPVANVQERNKARTEQRPATDQPQSADKQSSPAIDRGAPAAGEK